MKSFKYISIFVLGAVASALASVQFGYTKEGTVAGVDRAVGDTYGKRAYGFRVMQLDGYGGTSSGLTSPWNTAAVGPVLAVRRHLGELQQKSLADNMNSPKQPVLVRFEVTEAWIDTLHSSELIEVPVRSILYWASSRPGQYERFGVVQHVIGKDAEGKEVHSKAGASVSNVVVEVRDLFVTSASTGDGTYGGDGWNIKREKAISKAMRIVRDYNDAVAFYDTSLIAK
jgi:hypothetical protein